MIWLDVIINSFSRIFPVAVLFLLSLSAVGMETESTDKHIVEHEISSILQVLLYLPNNSEGVVVAFDWDETIIYGDGDDDSELREGDLTRTAVTRAIDVGSEVFILTSRYKGRSLRQIYDYSCESNKDAPPYCEINFKRAFRNYSDNLIEKYKLFPKRHKVFNFKDDDILRCLEINDKSLSRTVLLFKKDTSVITPHIVFAGSHKNKSVKGRMMAVMLDLHQEALDENKGDALFKSRRPIKHVIFIDNDPAHIKSMRKAFAQRKERLTLLYYPMKK